MTVPTGDGDRPLIAAAQRGERGAWNTLIARNDRWVRGVVYSTVGQVPYADDILQQVWMQVWQQIGTLSDPDKWRAWLYRLARNAAIDGGKAVGRQRRIGRPMSDRFDAPAVAPGPAQSAAADEEHQRILAAVRALPAIYREPFILRHLEGWNYAEIGETLDLPVDTVETRLVRARRLLRETLSGGESGGDATTRPAGADGWERADSSPRGARESQ